MSVAVGVDVGGTKIAVGIVDGDGRVLASDRVPLEPVATALDRSRASVLSVLRSNVQAGQPIGLGIGLPELVHPRGEILTKSVIGWSASAVRNAFDLATPVTIESDVRAAALAEAAVGAGRGASSVLFVNIGTGVSHTLVIDGRAWHGHHGAAILSGSTVMTVLDPLASRFVRGRCEDVASGRGIVDRYHALVDRNASARDILALAHAGDVAATRVRMELIELIGGLVGNLVDILDPEIVVLGGGVSRAKGFVAEVADVAHRTVWWPGARETPIKAAGLGDAAGVIGAALAAHRRIPY